MPFLHRLSQGCIYYPRMATYCFAGQSSDTLFSFVNSVMPLKRFPAIKLRDYDYPNSFVKRLSDHDFKTIAFHNNNGFFLNLDIALEKMGFQEFYDRGRMKLKRVVWGAPDHEMVKFIKKKLKIQDTPFFSYSLSMSSHFPYRMVRKYEGYYEEGKYKGVEDAVLRDYFHSMSYVDGVLEDYVSFVKDNIENAYIFIYGDHAAKNVRFPHSGPDYNFVPLLIVTPEGRAYNAKERQVSVLDLAPTVLYASGVPFEIRSGGINLLETPD